MLELLIINFGSPKFMCDTFGPRLGDKLEQIYKEETYITIVGTTLKPLCTQADIDYAKCLEDYAIKRGATVICTDAALGPKGTEGDIYWRKGQLKPGHVTGKDSVFMGHWALQYSVGDGSAAAPTDGELEISTDEALEVLQKVIKEMCTSNLQCGII